MRLAKQLERIRLSLPGQQSRESFVFAARGTFCASLGGAAAPGGKLQARPMQRFERLAGFAAGPTGRKYEP
jgi:hypothetical protein